jgi:hypothetical protein
MRYIKILYKDILARPSFYFFIFLIIFTIDRHHRFESSVNKENGPFDSDVLEYYTFLPEYFLDFKQVPELNLNTNKRTVGMAIMYSPAFLVGHLLAIYTHDVDDGYSPPYHWSIRWGSILYCILGLFFSRKSLRMFFNEVVTAITLACIFFGTNLFYYTYGWGELPHTYLFFLYSAFIFCTLRWIKEQKHTFLPIAGIIAGMIVLIRPTGAIVFLFPLLFDIHSPKALGQRLRYFVTKPSVTVLALILFWLPLLFQMFIWKHYVGQYVYYSYGKERFFFGDPQITNFLFSIRKGWLVYTPIMVFSLIGMVLCRKRLPSFYPFIIIFFPLNIYILSSWWEWSYGGSFGCRALIESYAFMIFPFAVFVTSVWELKIKKILSITSRVLLLLLFYIFILFNIFQTWQYKYQLIHWSGMNLETYKYIFLRGSVTLQERKYLLTKYTPPDPEKMMRGERDQ